MNPEQQPEVQQAQPEPVKPKCPYCKAELGDVGWLRNDEAGMITFFHAAPACAKVISIQAIAAQRRIISPN